MSVIAPELDLLDAASTMDDKCEINTIKAIDNGSQLTSEIVSSTASTASIPSKDDRFETKGQVKAETDILLPASPIQPPAVSPSSYADEDARNLAQKGYSRRTKAYMRALKDHGKAIGAREKLMEKRAKAA